jgi:lipoprotein-anchoring transpeptidase ErfK/SrfK
LAPQDATNSDPATVLTSTEPDTPAAAPAAAPAPPPPPTLILNADLSTQRLTVTENGVLKHTWAISSGRAGFATQTGTFRPQWASRLWHSRQYEMAPMPHAVFFNKGAAFHATTAVRMLGRPASHGCIRLAPTNAEALFKMVHKHGYARTKIIVHNGTKNKPVPVASKADAKRTAKAAQPAPRTVAAKPTKAQPDLRSRTSARETTSRLR